MPGMLEGIRVVETGQALADPLAGVILADLCNLSGICSSGE
jgi:crotonobetainyl-CoA:carnitine CoA-transferase CaiB-like acyl-CoA transferase